MSDDFDFKDKLSELRDSLDDFDLLSGLEDVEEDPDGEKAVARSFVRYWTSSGVTPLDMMISLNAGMGLPHGRSVLIYGPSGEGKSLWLYKWMQMNIANGGISFLIDVERGLEKRWVRELGLDQAGFIRVYRKKKPQHKYPPKIKIEQVFAFLHRLCRMVDAGWNLDPETGRVRPIMVGWDSISGCMSDKEFDLIQAKEDLEDDLGSSKDPTKMNYVKPAMALSEGFRNTNSALADRDILLVSLSQERKDLAAMMGSHNWRQTQNATKDTGGSAPTFYASLKMHCSRRNLLYHDPDNAGSSMVVGQVNSFHCDKNRLGPEGWTVQAPIYYLDGIDDADAMFKFLEDRRIIVCSGTKATLTLPDNSGLEFMKKDFRELYGQDEFREQLIQTISAWIEMQRHRKTEKMVLKPFRPKKG